MRELIDGLENIVHQIDQLVRAVSDGAGAKVGEAGAQMSENLRAAKECLEEVERDVKHTLKRAAKDTGRYVEEHPWAVIAVAAAAGFVIGALLASRRK